MKKILTVAVCSALSISSLFASEVVKFDKKTYTRKKQYWLQI